MVASQQPAAWFHGTLATGLRDLTSDPAALDSAGWWAVAVDFEGAVVCARFDHVRRGPLAGAGVGSWTGPAVTAWQSSLDEASYRAAVATTRRTIARGEVYQANICRVLRAGVPDREHADVAALAVLLAAGNPAAHSGFLRLPEAPGGAVNIASASPELFLRRTGRVVESGPIKGTGRRREDLQDKDIAENVMIVDLVRNDLGRVCVPGTVTVPELLEPQTAPGMVHLVSTVRGVLADGTGWPALLAATCPPGSVSGAPKSSALRLIADLETVPRGPYCGAFGWVDADRGTASLAVAIRTFWLAGEHVHLGTGAGITWGSDPAREWDETELKAAHLLRVAAGRHGVPVVGAGSAMTG